MTDRFGSFVTGLDYSASAVRTASDRTVDKRDRLEFIQGDLNTLVLPADGYDAAISIDSIYWVADLDKTIMSIAAAIKPGGRLGILIEQRVLPEDDDTRAASDNTEVARSLRRLDLLYDTVDYTTSFLSFWPRVREAALALRDEYVAEGTALICDNWIREAEEDYLPSVEAGLIKRYLYLVSI